MKDTLVRVERIRIQNFKNVEDGELTFSNPRRPDGASVLGLYGQNGSGKSALVDALEMVQQCIVGVRVSRRFAKFINVDADHAFIECELSIRKPTADEQSTVVYAFNAKCEEELSADPEDEKDNGRYSSRQVTRIYDEVLKIRIDNADSKKRLTTYIDTSDGTLFGSAPKRNLLIGSNTDKMIELTVEKKLAFRESRSFIFSTALHDAIREKWDGTQNADPIAATTLTIMESLKAYGRLEFFVLNTRDFSMPAIGLLPYAFRTKELVGSSFLPIEGTAVIPKDVYDTITLALDNMNIVLEQLIPGLTVTFAVLGTELTESGKEGVRVQVVSNREGRTIPLSCESEGIKRIVSFLNLMILMYNDPSATVVIDEIDAGVFEYLLGELLCIVSEHGKGQLIFTSHNLRPLETIDRGFIAFTTVNPKNRYWRMTNVKTTNNLRDFYYRDIVLGGQDEQLYEPTNNGDIEFAFIEAGVAGEA